MDAVVELGLKIENVGTSMLYQVNKSIKPVSCNFHWPAHDVQRNVHLLLLLLPTM